MSSWWLVGLYRDAAEVGRRDKEPSDDAMPDLVRCHAMDHIPDEDMPALAKAAHEVVQEALNAGVWVFGGGLENQRASVVATDGMVTDGPLPGGHRRFCVVDVPTREEALEWAAKNARAC
jgi:hypothetical protein